jgi:predicted transposase YdaD
MVIAGIPTDQLLHTRAAQDLLDRGRQEGEAQGEAQGEANVTLRLLNRRCGPLSETTTAEIQALPLEQLEALAEALLDFSGPADLTAWLEEHKG